MAHAVVIAGLGLMGRRMLGWMAAHDRFRVVAGFDPDDRAWERARAEGSVPPCRADSVDALVRANGAALLYIATPPSTHPPFARAALAQGLAIFCEKPLAIDVDDARRLVVEAEAAGVPTAVNFPFASMPQVAAMANACASGALGDVRRVEVHLQFSAWPRTWHTAGPWLSGAAEGGFLREVFSHFAYLTQQVVGGARWSVAWSRVERADAARAEHLATALLRCDGVPVMVTAGVAGGAQDHIAWTIYGTCGAARLTDWARVEWSEAGGPWRADDADPDARASRGARQLDALCERIEHGGGPLPALRDALAVQEVVEEMLSHARVG